MHDYVRNARKQYTFMQIVWGNESFQKYYNERSSKEKERLDGILERCRDNSRWERMDMLTERLTCHFKLVHQLCAREDFPLSAYPLLVQGLRNDINRGFTADIDEVLGIGARAEVIAMVGSRFNMDGHDPSGRKVGLLDRHHLMALLCDPFCHEWRSTFKVQTPLAILMRDMIHLYVPLDEDGGATSRVRVFAEFKVSLCDLFQANTFVTNILIGLCTLHISTRNSNSTLNRVSG